MSKNINEIFEKLLKRYVASLERDYKKRLKRAKDRQFVYDELQQGVEFALEMLSSGEERKNLVEVFEKHYKRGETAEYIYDIFRKTQSENAASYKRIGELEVADKENSENILNEEEDMLQNLTMNDRKLTKFFVRFLANKEMKIRLPKIFERFSDTEKQEKQKLSHDVKWTGSGDNKNEFVQLVYALYGAKRINNGNGEITKIVEELADIFQVPLGKNWQSNHSNSIHNRNKNYEPPIFLELENAYKRYEFSLVEKKKKRII